MHYQEVYNSAVVTQEYIDCIKRMPKVEIHVHLEGATSPQAVFRMAQRNHMALRRNARSVGKHLKFRDSSLHRVYLAL